MKKLSLIMVLVFIISTLSAVSFTAFADADTLMFQNDGIQDSTSNNVSVPANILSPNNDMPKLVSTNATTNSSGTITVDEIAMNVSAPQKPEGNGVWHVKYSGTTTGVWSGPVRNYSAPYFKLNKAFSGYDLITYEFDVYFASNASSVSVVFSDSTNNVKYANILASSSAFGEILNAASPNPDSSATYSGTGINKWHRVKVTCPINNTAGNINVYLDNSAAPVATSQNTVTFNGIQQNYNGFMFFTENSTTDVYLDNIKVYMGTGSVASETAPSVSSAVNGVVTVANGTKAGTLALDVTNGSVFGVYDSALTAKRADNDNVSNGDVIVTYAENGLYSYYTISLEGSAPVEPELLSVGTLGSIEGDNVVLNAETTAQALTGGAQYIADTFKIYASDGTTEKTGDTSISSLDKLVLTKGESSVEYTLYYYDTLISNLNCTATWQSNDSSMGGQSLPDGGALKDFINIDAPQKGTDKAMHITYTGNSTKEWDPKGKHIYYNAPRVYLNDVLDRYFKDNKNGWKYATYEFDVLFATRGSAIGVAFSPIAASSDKNILPHQIALMATSDADDILASSSGTKLTSARSSTYYDNVGVNKWRRVRIMYPVDGSGETIKVYVDNSLVAQSAAVPTTDIGLYNHNTKNVIFFPAYLQTSDVYVDNIKLYGGYGYIADDIKPSLSSVENGVINAGEVTLPASVSAGSLNAASSNGSVVGVYNSSVSVKKADTDTVSQGDVIVVSASNGLFSYYTVAIGASEGFEITNASLSCSGNSASVAYDYTNPSAAFNGKIIVAVYNGNQLIDAVCRNVIYSAGTGLSGSETFESSADISGATQIKAFFINDFDNLTPLCEAVPYIQ